jgi:aspartate kinase
MINQGSSEVSIMFGIKEEDLNNAIISLYNEFFN